MKILSVALFCLFLAGCASAPQLEFPTGKESARHPINVPQPPLSEVQSTTPAQSAPVVLNPAPDGVSQAGQALPSPAPGTAPKPSIRMRTIPASEVIQQRGQ